MTLDFSLLRACLQAQQVWLVTKANELQSGNLKASRPADGTDIDVSVKLAEEYQHRANNLQAVIECYERLNLRDSRH